MYVLIAGAGTVGSQIAEVLVQMGHAVGIIDNDLKKLDRLNSVLDVITYDGEATDRGLLKKARVDTAKLFVAATDSDEVNLTACALAKHLGAGKNLARVREDMYYVDREQIHKIFQLEMIFSPENIAAMELLNLIKTPGAYLVESFARGRAQLRSIRLLSEAQCIGFSLKDMNFPPDTIIAAIRRNGLFKIPSGSDVLETDDEVYFVGKPEALDEAEQQISGRKTSNKRNRIFIYGGSDIGMRLARMLEEGKYVVELLEGDAERAEELSEELRQATVVHGAATDVDLLKEERVERFDVFVAASRDSDENVISSILAKNLGTKSVITLVESMDYFALARQLGIHNVVCTRMATSNSIIRFIMRENVRSVTMLEEGKAEMVEVEVSPNAPAVGRRIQESGFPRESIVATIVRDDSVIIPRGEDRIMGGDIAIVFTHPKNIVKITNILAGH